MLPVHLLRLEHQLQQRLMVDGADFVAPPVVPQGLVDVVMVEADFKVFSLLYGFSGERRSRPQLPLWHGWASA